MKMTDYPAITKFTEDQIMIVDGNGGTKKITIADAILAALHMTSPTNHRMVFRGKNLGTVVTTEQMAAIQAGTFEDLWLGDYWVINGVTWRIVDFDYWYNKGDTACTKHHVVIMPDDMLYESRMNADNTTNGGYVGSEMYTTNLANAKAAIASAFGDSVVTHREWLCNNVANGMPYGANYYDSSIELPNEIMILGHTINSPATHSDKMSNLYTTSATQLALFANIPHHVVRKRHSFWLRDVVTSYAFAYIGHDSTPGLANASSNDIGVCPVFAIG